MNIRQLSIILASALLAGCTPAAVSPTPTELPPTAATLPTATVAPTPELVLGQWVGLVYDAALGQVVLVNGGPERGKPADDPLELWAWDSSDWRLLAADPAGPTWRGWAGVAYGTARGEIVINDGIQSMSVVFAETWTWDGSQWTQHPGASNAGREAAAMVYDEARANSVLFGGAIEMRLNGDTWTWDGVEWTLAASEGPTPRFPSAWAYDPTGEQVLLFGAHEPTIEGDSVDRADLWAWDGESWIELLFEGEAPDKLPGSAMVYDGISSRMMLYGGFTDGSTPIWYWDGVAWERVETNGPVRAGHALVYDPVANVVMLAGGVNRPGGTPIQDSWVWDGETWTCVWGCE
jgi:hypothetical protein